MRITLNLPDTLIAASKERAREQGKTLENFVEHALRARLDEKRISQHLGRLPVWGRRDEKILVDIADRDALWK